MSANSLYIDVSGLIKLQGKLKSIKTELENRLDDVLNANAEEIATTAKRLAPKDFGQTAASISANTAKKLEKHISVNVFWAAYMEFGTGQFAAEYVASLPEDWQQYASQFRGSTGERGLLEKIQEWTRRKGIATGKDYKSVGYLIYRSILIHGIHPHPYLFPAFEQQKPKVIKDVENVVKFLTK